MFYIKICLCLIQFKKNIANLSWKNQYIFSTVWIKKYNQDTFEITKYDLFSKSDNLLIFSQDIIDTWYSF